MQTTEAIQYLSTFERRMRPTPPPWNRDADVRNEWVELLTHYDNTTASEAFKALERHHGGSSKWPNWVQLRDALNRARRRTLQPADHDQGEPVPLSVGIAIAWDAYCEEVTAQGRTPSERRFARWFK